MLYAFQKLFGSLLMFLMGPINVGKCCLIALVMGMRLCFEHYLKIFIHNRKITKFIPFFVKIFDEKTTTKLVFIP